MANGTIKNNYTKASEIVNVWNNSINVVEQELSSVNINQLYSELVDLGLDQGFSKDYEKSLKSVTKSLKTQANSLKQILRNAEDIEYDIRTNMPGGGKDSNNDDGQTDDNQYEDTYQIDESSLNLKLEEYKKLSMSDLDAVTQVLIKYAKDNNISIYDLLNNEENATLLKELLKNNSSLSDNLKNILLSDNDKVLQSSLKSMYTGENNSLLAIDDTNKNALKLYLESMTKNNDNMSIKELASNYPNTLKTYLKEYAKMAQTPSSQTNEELTMFEKLKDCYDKEEFDIFTPPLMSVFNQISDEYNCDIQAVLESENPEIIGKVNDSFKYANYVNMISEYSIEDIIKELGLN